MPSLNKQNLNNVKAEDLSRYNRSFEVFASVRGTASYYEKSKKNLMALLRQLGCPTVFLTLSCAEYDWPSLLKEIAETVYRRNFTFEEIEEMTIQEKNRLISENVVITTLHFNKRFQKLFSLMKLDFFKGENVSYHVVSFFFRLEFQMRGAPHVHSLLWMKNNKQEEAPSFWTSENIDSDNIEETVKKIEEMANILSTTNPDDVLCQDHFQEKQYVQSVKCSECETIKAKASKYQTHYHTATCRKKGKLMNIRKN